MIELRPQQAVVLTMAGSIPSSLLLCEYYDLPPLGNLRVWNDDIITRSRASTSSHRTWKSSPMYFSVPSPADNLVTRVHGSGNVQVMSAGTGIAHGSTTWRMRARIFQIWIIPDEPGLPSWGTGEFPRRTCSAFGAL